MAGGLIGCKTSSSFISAGRVQWEKTYQNPKNRQG